MESAEDEAADLEDEASVDVAISVGTSVAVTMFPNDRVGSSVNVTATDVSAASVEDEAATFEDDAATLEDLAAVDVAVTTSESVAVTMLPNDLVGSSVRVTAAEVVASVEEASSWVLVVPASSVEVTVSLSEEAVTVVVTSLPSRVAMLSNVLDGSSTVDPTSVSEGAVASAVLLTISAAEEEEAVTAMSPKVRVTVIVAVVSSCADTRDDVDATLEVAAVLEVAAAFVEDDTASLLPLKETHANDISFTYVPFAFGALQIPHHIHIRPTHLLSNCHHIPATYTSSPSNTFSPTFSPLLPTTCAHVPLKVPVQLSGTG